MDTAGDHVEFVRSSSVRTAALRTIRESTPGTSGLVDALDASESAVYGAVNDLADRGLVVDRDDGWRPTGLGVVVCDCLDRERRIERAVATDARYWERHDPSAIPPRHRRFEVFADATVLRGSDADPHRVTRAVADRIRDAESARVLSPIYHREFAAAVATCAEARVALDRSVVDEVAAGSLPDRDPEFPVRVADVSFSLTVTGDCALLSLPLLDGSYDARAEVVSESPAAVEWGRDLFESYWADATPVDG